jgi:hypothetical protein
MKKLIIIYILGFLSIGAAVQAQSSLTIDASQNITNFSYENSLGEKDKEYKANYSGSFSVGYRNILSSGVIIRGSLGMRNAGATLVVNEINNTYNFQYFEAKIGGGYLYSLSDKLGVYMTASPYFGYLLKARQNLLNNDIDIINDESINKVDYGIYITPGVNFNMSEFIAAYFELNVMRGLANLETDESQKSHNTLIGFSLGLAFTIK